MITRRAALVLSACIGFAGPAGAQTTAFVDESVARGVLFRHGDTSATQTMGGGVAFFDYDGDGDEDLFVTSSDGNHRLFEHIGGKFVDRTAGSGLQKRQPDTMGVIVGDYNQDGRPDLYLTNFGANQLYTNLGGGKFRDDAALYGLQGNDWSVSAAWADFDRDGDLDLYVGDYVQKNNFPYNLGTPNKLYLNVGTRTQPRFVEVATSLGVEDKGVFPPARQGFPYPTTFPSIKPGAPAWGCTLSVSTRDFDSDGDQDILIGNDFGWFVLPNRLYRNDSTGGVLKFTDISAATGFSDDPHYNMGISGADFDHDGDWDFYHSNLGPNIFQENRAGKFVNIAAQAGPIEHWNDKRDKILSSWGTIFCDFDNDLWEDLMIVNGFINGAIVNLNDPNSQNHIWMNLGTGKFKRVDPVFSGMADTGAGRGVAASDVDGDGRMDFYVMNNGGPTVASATDRCRLFMNRSVTKNHWIQLRLHGWLSNLEAMGARLTAEVGGQVLRRQVLGDPCYLSSGTRLVHFGLGSNRSPDRIRIDWPSGIHQELIGIPGDQRFDILEPSVTMDTSAAPVYSNGAMRWSVALTNRSNSYRIIYVTWFLLLGKGGPLVLTLQKVSFLGANGKGTLEVAVPMPQAMRAAISGLSIEQRAYAVSAGAVDSRSRVDQLK